MTPTPRSTRHSRRLAATAMVGLFALVAASCGSKPDPLEIGFRRVSLDLVFKDAAKATPPDPQKVIQTIEYFDQEFPGFAEQLPLEEFDEEPAPRPRRPPPPAIEREPVCIAGGDGLPPDEPVFPTIREAPKEGSYRRGNTGTIGLELPPPLPSGTLPFPPRTTWEITDVGTHRGTVALNPQDEEALPPLPNPAPTTADVVPRLVRFTITRNVSRTLKTVDTYQYYLERGEADRDSTNNDGDGIYLVRREIRSTTLGNSVFTPTPPVMVVPISVETEDTEANVSAGIDRESDAALSISSRVVGRETVDVCGEIIDTYRVQWEEQFTSLSSDNTQASGNAESGKPNFWSIAYSKNVLLVREEMHTVYRVATNSTPPVPIVLKFDYVSTLRNVEPEPIKPSTSGAPAPTPTDEDEAG